MYSRLLTVMPPTVALTDLTVCSTAVVALAAVEQRARPVVRMASLSPLVVAALAGFASQAAHKVALVLALAALVECIMARHVAPVVQVVWRAEYTQVPLALVALAVLVLAYMLVRRNALLAVVFVAVQHCQRVLQSARRLTNHNWHKRTYRV